MFSNPLSASSPLFLKSAGIVRHQPLSAGVQLDTGVMRMSGFATDRTRIEANNQSTFVDDNNELIVREFNAGGDKFFTVTPDTA